jgi:hypothetical protein
MRTPSGRKEGREREKREEKEIEKREAREKNAINSGHFVPQ